MADFSPIDDDEVVLLGVEAAGVISGVVISGVQEVQRRVMLYQNGTLADVVFSSTVDGSYSFSVIANANDVFRVLAIGEEGENSQIFDRVHLP